MIVDVLAGHCCLPFDPAELPAVAGNLGQGISAHNNGVETVVIEMLHQLQFG